MATFQSITVIIAIVILIIILIIVGIALVQGKKKAVWPPVIGDCPDYWLDLSGNGAACMVNAQKVNQGTATVPMNFTLPTFSGSNGPCAKYTWAIQNNVSWDGLTYGVANPCTTKPASTS